CNDPDQADENVQQSKCRGRHAKNHEITSPPGRCHVSYSGYIKAGNRASLPQVGTRLTGARVRRSLAGKSTLTLQGECPWFHLRRCGCRFWFPQFWFLSPVPSCTRF